MELKVWSKTLLNVYGCLYKLTNEIDKIVLHYALSSGFKNGVNKTYRDTQNILDLTQRKITLINLKVLIESCLDKLDLQSCKILTLRYVDRMSGETISTALNIKRRTYFRKYQQALNSFSSTLLKNGFDSNNILALVKNEAWIIDVYKAFLDKEISKNQELEISNYSIYSLAVRNYKKQINYPIFA